MPPRRFFLHAGLLWHGHCSGFGQNTGYRSLTSTHKHMEEKNGAKNRSSFGPTRYHFLNASGPHLDQIFYYRRDHTLKQQTRSFAFGSTGSLYGFDKVTMQ